MPTRITVLDLGFLMEFSPLWDIAVVRMVTGVAAVAEVCAVGMILVSTYLAVCGMHCRRCGPH